MTCCFIGHREIEETEQLTAELHRLLTALIARGVTDFLFGDHSAFDTLCYTLVTELQKEHPCLRRIHFRMRYPEADEMTMEFLLSGYEDCICLPDTVRAGRASYVLRNRAMMRESDVCIFYCNPSYIPQEREADRRNHLPRSPRKSGTRLAYDYARSQKKEIYNVFPNSAPAEESP